MAKSHVKPAAKTAAAKKQPAKVEVGPEMGKVAKNIAAVAEAPKSAPAKEAKVPLAKMRGPRGVAETAKIHLLSKDNPKRPGSKASQVFACYKDGMTVGAFCDAVDATPQKGQATPNLVYDAGHGFISIDGYDPGEIIKPKERAPKVEKAPKALSGRGGKGSASAPKKDAEAEADANTEMVD